MCGITGILNLDASPIEADLLLKMTSALSHRGPDDEGYLLADINTGRYIKAGGKDTPRTVFSSHFKYRPENLLLQDGEGPFNLALGHRRLSIIDLSPGGHQPMCNETGTLWIVQNGEVYNYVEIREELRDRGHSFVSNSDTEVIIKAYEEWGVRCLDRFNGMWAFCLWDTVKKELFCARDRLGVKPFYYYLDGHVFAFASEIKALLQLDIDVRPNDGLIFDYLKYGMLDHTDETLFSGIVKLPPAHYLRIGTDGKMLLQRYWDFETSNQIDSCKSDAAYADEFLDLFTDAVRIRLRSDVPIGSCLSGGLDSSSVVVIANNLMFPQEKALARERQKTFSACFEDRAFDERVYIETVIDATGAEKNYVFPTPETFLSDLDNLLWHQEEPGGCSNSVQWTVFKRARDNNIQVLLDGQGGDELLAGYRKFYLFYFMELQRNHRFSRLFSEAANFFLSPDILATLNLKSGLRYFDAGNRLLKVGDLLSKTFTKQVEDNMAGIGYQGNLGLRMKEDLTRYSLPVLLRYEDKNSMAHAIETRLPFLDYRLVEMLASLPIDQKMRRGWTKYVLRNAMKGILPEKVRLRKTKLGFTPPEENWLKTRLHPAVRDSIERSVFISNYADTKKLMAAFNEYLSGKSVYFSSLFYRFFELELWGRRFICGGHQMARNAPGSR